MKLSYAVFCLIIMLGMSTVVVGYKCHIRCAPRAQGAQRKCQEMEKLGLQCQSTGNEYKICMEKCNEQLLKEIERENQAKNERFRQNQLRREELRERNQKHRSQINKNHN